MQQAPLNLEQFPSRLFFEGAIGDFHCGLRGFRADAICGLNLETTGMEFASEMVVKSALARLQIAEVPTTLRPDGRSASAPADMAGRLAPF